MIRFNAILTRVIRELWRDKRTLALMLFAPVLVLTLMNVVFNTNEETHVQIGVADTLPSEITKAFPADQVKLKEYSPTIDQEATIKHDDLDAFITLDGTTLAITYENADPSNTAKVKALVSSVLTTNKLKELSTIVQKLASQSGQKLEISEYTLTDSYLYGSKNSTFFDKIFPALIGFFVFLFVFLISGIALLRERTSGTLERLLATPVKRSEIVLGYLTGYGLFAILQTVILVLYAIYLLDLAIAGNILWVLVTNILIALVALTMGIFVSTFANSEFQMIQFIPLIAIPQVFFSGILSLDTMTPWVRNLGYLFPLSYAGNALTDVMIKGVGFETLWPNLSILVLFVLAFTFLNILGLKRYRKV